MIEQQDDVMAAIAAIVGLARGSDTANARRRFAEIWHRVGPSGDPLHRCTLAHYAADVQTDLNEELRWDLRALEAAAEISTERAKDYHPSLAVAGFFPSLHLNLADVCRRLGDGQGAIRHIAEAQASVESLGDDGYGRMIRDGIARCAARIDAESEVAESEVTATPRT